MLASTYDACTTSPVAGALPLLPIAHTTQKAHVEIRLTATGVFRGAGILEGAEQTTVIPCTENSSGRSGKKPTSHPLCDKLQYVAADFGTVGGEVTVGFKMHPTEPHQEYLRALREWRDSEHSHKKLEAILAYVERGTVMRDLIRESVLPVDQTGMLVKQWGGAKTDAPSIFKSLSAAESPDDAFVRWRVEDSRSPVSGVWEDQQLVDAWIARYRSMQASEGLCTASGEPTKLAIQHPKKLRHPGDSAKLISANDKAGFTFLGRFLDDKQAACVGYEMTQKAHLALRWLVERQGARRKQSSAALGIAGQVLVAWCVAGKAVPDPCAGGLEEFDLESLADDPAASVSDFGQAYALRLKNAMRGYREDLTDSDDIVVMGLDSATPGRLAITLYRELTGSEFLDRIETWHTRCAWPQDYGPAPKTKRRVTFLGAPSPIDIARAALGRTASTESGKKLAKSMVERLAPCIIDGLESHSIPVDVVNSVVRQTCNRLGYEREPQRKREDPWQKNLGIACAVFRGLHYQRDYQMALEEDRSTRDYLYGRLLAIAEHIEDSALRTANEKRDTNVAKLMQRFSERPSETWLTIWRSLPPYEGRLKAKYPGSLAYLKDLMDEVTSKFDPNEFTADRPLTGEFLLGYHCQRRNLQEWRLAKRTRGNESTEAATASTTTADSQSSQGE
jgi:CRISPR-associated protein Csd1